MTLVSAICDNCGGPYDRHRPGQRFCKEPCRLEYHRKKPAGTGPLGSVKGVRRIARGTSVIVHFYDQDEAERAIAKLRYGQAVRVEATE